VEPGETVDVGTPLAELDSGAKPGEPHPEEHDDEPRASAPEPVADSPREEAPRPVGEADRSGFHSPVVRRMAEQHGIDLSQVQGTGVGGRIRKRDLLALIESGPPQEAPAEAAEERPLHIESPYRPEGPPAKPEPAHAGNGAAAHEVMSAGRREPMSPMRKQIATHMLESRRTSAHCTTVVEVDLSRVVAARRELKEAMGRRGVRLTYLAFVAAATVEALGRRPIFNASIEGDEIVYHDDVNLGIAVALEAGLIVPVIRHAQRLNLEGLAAEIGDLADRAREGQLQPDDVAGGTFTITNPGQFGAVLATPIINQPQVAILDLEAVVKRPVVIGEDGDESIAIRPMTNLCMSWDHRALDGAESARFLGEVKDRLEGWER
jgi:2-oxoglutarate dehydrogenase E2 component (dihydrolipoamide succinyltransferase)